MIDHYVIARQLSSRSVEDSGKGIVTVVWAVCLLSSGEVGLAFGLLLSDLLQTLLRCELQGEIE